MLSSLADTSCYCAFLKRRPRQRTFSLPFFVTIAHSFRLQRVALTIFGANGSCSVFPMFISSTEFNLSFPGSVSSESGADLQLDSVTLDSSCLESNNSHPFRFEQLQKDTAASCGLVVCMCSCCIDSQGFALSNGLPSLSINRPLIDNLGGNFLTHANNSISYRRR